MPWARGKNWRFCFASWGFVRKITERKNGPIQIHRPSLPLFPPPSLPLSLLPLSPLFCTLCFHISGMSIMTLPLHVLFTAFPVIGLFRRGSSAAIIHNDPRTLVATSTMVA